MRSTRWFLIIGVVVLGGLLTIGIQSAYAGDELQEGTYEGMINLAIHSWANVHTSAGGQTYEGNVTINWIGDGNVDLTVTDAKHGMIQVNIPVDVFDFGHILFTQCNASVGIKAKGLFSGMVLGSNFDPIQKTGTVPLVWNGPDSVQIVYDTVQGGCWTKHMSDAQLTAIEEAGPTIGEIILTVTTVDDVFISGRCSLPKWEGSGGIPNGSYTHLTDACHWWAFKVDAQEGGSKWKDK